MKLLRTMTAVLAFCGCCVAAVAATNGIPWRIGAYTLTARAMPVRQALETFAVAQSMPVVMSKAVSGTVSGSFVDVPAGAFLDKIATINNLVWYHDGATLYVYGASETVSTLIDLKYMKADELQRLLRQFGVEDERFPIKAGRDGELIMVAGPPRYVELVTELIARADNLREQRTFNEVEVRLFPLVYTWADTVTISVTTPETSLAIKGIAQILQEMTRSEASEKALQGTNALDQAGTAAAGLGTRVKPVISAENRLNAVMIRDSVTRMPMYEEIIRSLDKPVKIVEVAITTVELSKTDALDWQLSLSVSGGNDSGLHTAAGGMNVDNLQDLAKLTGRGLSGGYTYLGDNVTVATSLSALKAKSKVRGIPRTSLVTLNNFGASISDSQTYNARVVGEKVANLQSVSAGTTFRIKPRAVKPQETNALHDVWITLEIQDGGFESAKVDGMPMKRNTTLTEISMVREGQSLVLAGYLRDVEGDAGWGIPYLRELPLIGWLFGGASETHETVQRLFVLTPRVIEYAAKDTPVRQTVRLRDTTEPEELAETAERVDDDRRVRRQETDEVRRIYREKSEDTLRRRGAEIERDARDRELERLKAMDVLEANKRSWHEDFEKRKAAYEAIKKVK